MGLTKSHQSLITKAKTASSGELGVALDDATCAFLIATIVNDLHQQSQFPEIPEDIPSFFNASPLHDLRLENINILPLFEKLISVVSDADTYFYCLAVIHKARLKYERILQSQAIPTIEQVGPRGLLQYGTLSPKALSGFLFWRKWLFDIDNRAGQETGYIFEPIIAYAIGGVPYSAKKSPIKRGGTGQAGRQVDCIRDQWAYEIKLRVTIAASGQGRWSEELEFPRDCRASNYTPVLIVLDPTPNPKLLELQRAFEVEGGESYIGQAAWDHLASLAGPTMAQFLQLYVHIPIQALLHESPKQLSQMSLRMEPNRIIISIDDETLVIDRRENATVSSEEATLPDDVDEASPLL